MKSLVFSTYQGCMLIFLTRTLWFCLGSQYIFHQCVLIDMKAKGWTPWITTNSQIGGLFRLTQNHKVGHIQLTSDRNKILQMVVAPFLYRHQQVPHKIRDAQYTPLIVMQYLVP